MVEMTTGAPKPVKMIDVFGTLPWHLHTQVYRSGLSAEVFARAEGLTTASFMERFDQSGVGREADEIVAQRMVEIARQLDAAGFKLTLSHNVRRATMKEPAAFFRILKDSAYPFTLEILELYRLDGDMTAFARLSHELGFGLMLDDIADDPQLAEKWAALHPYLSGVKISLAKDGEVFEAFASGNLHALKNTFHAVEAALKTGKKVVIEQGEIPMRNGITPAAYLEDFILSHRVLPEQIDVQNWNYHKAARTEEVIAHLQARHGPQSDPGR
jgi:hypothetical protein